jgi:hypothetical protein
MSRSGGWGNAWPTEVAEGWLPGPTIIFAQFAMRSQPSGTQKFGLVGADCHLPHASSCDRAGPVRRLTKAVFHFHRGAFVKTSGFGLMLLVAVDAIIGLA